MDHVVGIGRIVARESAQQRDQSDALGVQARELLDRGGQSPAVAHSDHSMLAAFDLAPQVSGTDKAERAQRQPFLAEIRRDLAVVELIAGCEPTFEVDAFDDVAVDAHLDDAIGDGARDEPVRLYGRDAQPLGHCGLRQSAGVVEPDRSYGEGSFGVRQCQFLCCSLCRAHTFRSAAPVSI